LGEEGDFRAIEKALTTCRRKVPLRRDIVRNEVEMKPLLAKDVHFPCVVLHFNGHGVKGMGMLVEKGGSSGGELTVIPIQDITDALSKRTELRFVFLNVCESLDIARMIVRDTGVVCAVGTTEDLPDPAYNGIQEVVERMYMKMLQGVSVGDSLESACRATCKTADVHEDILKFLGYDDREGFSKDKCKYKVVGDEKFSL
tara:strand:+ start:4186 stop:4785 length:600 start_codon:yes stop_codon:yes gene_type:complete